MGMGMGLDGIVVKRQEKEAKNFERWGKKSRDSKFGRNNHSI
jgi:hypothetical protein